MAEPLRVGETFPIHFVWQLPDGDYIRVIFQAEVVGVIDPAERYLLQLAEFVAGRQESADGREIRPKTGLAFDYWEKVVGLIGRKITVAWEAADGRPLHLRLTTLTGEHDFFRRHNNL